MRQPLEKNTKNNDLTYISNHKKLTKEEKEKILNIFNMIDIDLEISPKIQQNIIHSNFLRVKSPNRLEKLIENTKFYLMNKFYFIK